MASIWSSLANLPDPRNGDARRLNLLDIPTIALIVSIRGAETEALRMVRRLRPDHPGSNAMAPGKCSTPDCGR